MVELLVGKISVQCSMLLPRSIRNTQVWIFCIYLTWNCQKMWIRYSHFVVRVILMVPIVGTECNLRRVVPIVLANLAQCWRVIFFLFRVLLNLSLMNHIWTIWSNRVSKPFLTLRGSWRIWCVCVSHTGWLFINLTLTPNPPHDTTSSIQRKCWWKHKLVWWPSISCPNCLHRR